ncbi:MAG: hypothetical protein AMXMBFR66_33240 [Pseudomonadota bacterium]|nr:hypothetical protein [Rubrivivax sp.]NLZ41490.1 hypothetical protein [Comamonadaceae bacterium]
MSICITVRTGTRVGADLRTGVRSTARSIVRLALAVGAAALLGSAAGGVAAAAEVLDANGDAVAPVAEALPIDPETTTRPGLYATPAQAYRAQQIHGARVLLLDVRSTAERRRSGVAVATNLWQPLLPETAAERSADFLPAIARAVQALPRGRSTAIFVVCENGRTAAAAVDLLAAAGYKNVVLVTGGLSGEVEGGRSGWSASGLPLRRIGS